MLPLLFLSYQSFGNIGWDPIEFDRSSFSTLLLCTVWSRILVRALISEAELHFFLFAPEGPIQDLAHEVEAGIVEILDIVLSLAAATVRTHFSEKAKNKNPFLRSYSRRNQSQELLQFFFSSNWSDKIALRSMNEERDWKKRMHLCAAYSCIIRSSK